MSHVPAAHKNVNWHVGAVLVVAAAIVHADDNSLALMAESLPPLPIPAANNAVAAVTVNEHRFLVSFAGLGGGKSHNDTLARTFVFDETAGAWSEADPIPGDVGRLAATAAGVGERAYVFGGYAVAGDHSEVSTPWVHSFDPVSLEFKELTPMPVPVDDAVSVPYQDRYIYLISGWHDYGNVNLVQRYDTATDHWEQATPIPGRPVFGHAGGIVDNRIVYCDGVAVRAFAEQVRDFVANEECFLGIIDNENSRRIDWRAMPPHPGEPRYRMAAAGIAGSNAVLFIGGSENPYNYNGIGYDGRLSEPAAGAWLFELNSLAWRGIRQKNAPTMDHRALAALGDAWVTVGGMLAGQHVTDKVVAYSLRR